jgi:hypothetical protein
MLLDIFNSFRRDPRIEFLKFTCASEKLLRSMFLVFDDVNPLIRLFNDHKRENISCLTFFPLLNIQLICCVLVIQLMRKND